MEAVPRLPMLRVDLKDNQGYVGMDWMDAPPDSTKEALQQNLKDELNRHIRENYSDDPEKYKECVNSFLELQRSAYSAIENPDFEGCNTIKKYYGQLHFMQSRFPFTGENSLNVNIGWGDAYTGMYTQHSTLVFEQTAILFNLGAIHSYLGSVDNRTSEEGTKVSCVHFQCAAGFFQYIADHLDTTLSLDISQFMLKLFINTMLGQGQECLLEKSMQDNRKHSIIAKICKQVVDYYQAALNSLTQPEAKELMGDANKTWTKLLLFKVTFYSAVVKYYLGSDDWEQENYGQGLSYLGAGLDGYNEAVKICKNLKGELKAKVDDALKYSADVFGGRYNSAKKDNDFIYHDRVPDKATLPDAKGASLVKALPFDPSNPAITGPDIFGKLVPLEAHLAASSYSEEKAKLLRPVLAEVEEKNVVLEQYKRAIELDPDKLIKVDDEDRLNPALVEHCASLSVDQTPILELTKAMKELSNVYMDIDTIINETVSLIEEEETEAKQVKDVCGKTVDSTDEIDNIKKELDVCNNVHEKAGQMNDDLHTAMKIHIANLKIVSEGLNALKKECKFTSTSELITEEDREVITLVEKLCSKVVEMEVQRQSLVAQLRSQLEEDDVTSALMTKPGIDAEDLFQDELKKHDPVIGYIKQNLSAQENILTAVTEANVRYTKIRKVVDAHKQKVGSKCDSFLLSCTGYTEAVQRCREGTDFFKELLDKVKDISETMTKLNEKNIKLRKTIMEKHEAKKPPPRPSAPKPKLPAAKPAPGKSLFSSEELADLADDMEEFNDPAFLRYLQMSGGLPPGMSVPNAALPTSQPRLPAVPAMQKRAPMPTSYGSGNIPQTGNNPIPSSMSYNPNMQSHSGGPNVPQVSHFAPSNQIPPQSNFQQSNIPAATQQATMTRQVNMPAQQLPMGVNPQPMSNHQPSVPANQPAMPTHQPVMQTSQTAMPAHQLPMSMQQPSVAGQQPFVPTQRFNTPGQQPNLVNQQPNLVNQQPPTPQQHPSDQHSTMCSQRPIMSLQESTLPQQVSLGHPIQPIDQTGIYGHQPHSVNTNLTQPQSQTLHGGQFPGQGFQQNISQSFVTSHTPASTAHGQTGPHPRQDTMPPNYQHSTINSYQNPSSQSIQQPPLQGYQQPISHGPQQPTSSVQSYQQPVPPAQRNQQQTSRGNQQPPTQGYQHQASQGNQQPPTQGYQQQTSRGNQQPLSQGYQQQGSQGNQQPPTQGYQQQGSQGNQQPPTQGYQQQGSQGNQQPPTQGYQQQGSQGNQQPPTQGYQQQGSQGNQQPLSQGYQQQGSQGNQQPPTQGNQQPPTQGYQQQGSQGNQQPLSQGNQQPFSQGYQQQTPKGYQQTPVRQQLPSQGYRQLSPQGNQLPPSQGYQQSPSPGYRQPTSQGYQQAVLSPRSPAPVNNTPIHTAPYTQQPPAGYHQQAVHQSVRASFQKPAAGPVNQQAPAPHQPAQNATYPQNVQQRLNFRQPNAESVQNPHTYGNRIPGSNGPPQRFSNQPAPAANFQGNQGGPTRLPNPVAPGPRMMGMNRMVNPNQQIPTQPPPSQSPVRPVGLQPTEQVQYNNPSTGSVNFNVQRGLPQHQTPAPLKQPQPPAGGNQQANFPPQQNTNYRQPPGPNATQQHVTSNTTPPPHTVTQPLTPTVIGEKAMPAPMQPLKPSADLEGLTYIPSDVLRPKTSSTSADELLSASPEPELPLSPQHKSMLVPTKVDDEDTIVRRIEGIPYDSEADLMKFKADTEAFHQMVSTLLVKVPGSLCQLDKDWKQLSDLQEKHARQQSTAIGRCSSYKNRFQDVLPFDQNRIVIMDSKDDYINASSVDGISNYCPRFIAAQSPLLPSSGDFWTMIHEQQVTLIVMLVSKNEVPKKCAKYWPDDRNLAQKHGALSITFTTSRVYQNYIERTFTLKHAKSSLSRSVTQLQYTAWPEHGLPASSNDLLSFMRLVHNFHTQQRSLQWPIIVHCENGVSHTGTFCAAYACVQELDAGLGIPNILNIVEKMRMKRKYMLQEKAQLKFLHDLVYIHAVDLLKQRGVNVGITAPQQPAHVVPQVQTSSSGNFDVFGSSALSSIRASVEKMTVKPDKNLSSTNQSTQAMSLPTNNGAIPDEPDLPTTDINSLIGSNVSDLVQGTINYPQPSEPILPTARPDVVSSCTAPERLSEDGQLHTQNNTMPTEPYTQTQTNANLPTDNYQNAPQQPAVQPVHSAPPEPPSNGSILDQLTPESFTLGSEVKERNRITKADFFRPRGEGISATKNKNDPFGDLDPLWGLKK